MKLILGDCLEVLRGMPDNSVDAIVTDPPYGLGKEPDAFAMLRDWIETGHHEVKGRGFMGKEWDAFVPQPQVWHECLRVLKPGGHLLAFAGTRTQDLMCLGLRLAGFEIRDLVAWVYGSGFPKSLDVSKAIDKAAGVELTVVGENPNVRGRGNSKGKANGLGDYGGFTKNSASITEATSEAAKQWDGWGTALKPALEPITLARKPLEGTVAANVLKWHTGALNIDGCRVATEDKLGGGMENGTSKVSEGWDRPWRTDEDAIERNKKATAEKIAKAESLGRWPANLIHDGSDEVVGLFPDRKTTWVSPKHANNRKGEFLGELQHPGQQGFNDSGSAARFFYAAKCSKAERDKGCEHLPEKQEGLQLPRGKCKECGTWKNAGEKQCVCGGEWEMTSNPPPKARNNHPTVKPQALMRYLCKLVTPPDGIVLDPYMGSGSTGVAALEEGFHFIGIERDPDYFKIAQARILGEAAFEFS